MGFHAIAINNLVTNNKKNLKHSTKMQLSSSIKPNFQLVFSYKVVSWMPKITAIFSYHWRSISNSKHNGIPFLGTSFLFKNNSSFSVQKQFKKFWCVFFLFNNNSSFSVQKQFKKFWCFFFCSITIQVFLFNKILRSFDEKKINNERESQALLELIT